MKSTLLFALCISMSVTLAAQSTLSNSKKIVEHYAKLPLAFEANQGQTDPQVKFLSRGAGYSLFLTAKAAILSLREPALQESSSESAKAQHAPKSAPRESKSAALRMRLLGANPEAKVIGQDAMIGKSNYFVGNDPKKWHTNVPQFAKVRYENVYPGVDLVYYGRERELEYDFMLQPGASPKAIRLGIEGAKKLWMEHGDLVLTTTAGDVHLLSPRIYQEANGMRQEVSGGYLIKGENEVEFEIGDYERRRALVIDPVLAYSTYLGGSLSDSATGIAVDSAGNAFVTGQTISNDFPVDNALQGTKHESWDVFVTKINADGTALVYSTYLGGNAQDGGYSIAVGSAGNVYVTGYTASTDFPTVNPIQPANHAHFFGETNAFVTKIKASGDAIVYSTYLGGSGNDSGSGIAVDKTGDVSVTGAACSLDFPTANALQPVNGGGCDAFVTKINAAGSAFVYSTYLGGAKWDQGNGIAVDSVGNAYVVGSTQSLDFPTKNAIQGANSDIGAWSAFVTKITSDGSALAYSTYLGGTIVDYGNAIAVDSSGRAYVTGYTASFDSFPTKNAIQPSSTGPGDAFVTKINASGSGFVYSTYLGGSGDDAGGGIAVDSKGNVYVTGSTDSYDFPTVSAIQPSLGGKRDAFVTKINASGNAFVYSTYLGGNADDRGGAVRADSVGSAYVTGSTYSKGPRGFPTTAVALQPSTTGVPDAFVAKIAAQTFVSLSKLKLSFPTLVIGTTSAIKTITVTNQGTSSLPVNGIFVGGLNASDFAQTNTCDSSLAAGASCTISVTFAPTTKGTRKAGVGISSSDPASPNAIALSGTGTVVSLSTTKLSFGVHPVGTTSAPQTVTLTNVGSTQLDFSGISITGIDREDFSQTNNCGTSIAAHASCTITVTFNPTATGKRGAAVIINDNGGGSPQRVALAGTGT